MLQCAHMLSNTSAQNQQSTCRPKKIAQQKEGLSRSTNTSSMAIGMSEAQLCSMHDLTTRSSPDRAHPCKPSTTGASQSARRGSRRSLTAGEVDLHNCCSQPCASNGPPEVTHSPKQPSAPSRSAHTPVLYMSRLPPLSTRPPPRTTITTESSPAAHYTSRAS